MKRRLTTSVSAMAVALMGFSAATVTIDDAYAAKELDQAVKLRLEGIAQSAQSQQKIDRYDDDESQLLAEYKATLKKLEALKVYNKQLEDLISEQVKQMASLQEQIDRVTDIDRQITPLMLQMIEGLKMFVENDVPFLSEERATRLAGLDSLMANADVTPAERFRKILEAYQIENEYGRTIEAYRGALTATGQERTVEYLRVGRITFIYQTLDGEESGVWNVKTRSWDTLDSDYTSSIRQGLRIANKQAAPDLMILPVAGPEVAQ
ncbi:MAG: DUF3450 domain-containing protein [Alphaproteobacteria bacterium]